MQATPKLFDTNKPTFWIILFWLLLTAFNLTKAFHMDDSFHIEAAKHLQNHPLSPMSGEINWSSDPVAMHGHNQPPLYFYSLALVMSVFGESEIALHLYQSIFTFLALFFFSKISEILDLKNQLVLLILFALCPALLINQNIMTDVPLLSLLLASTYFLLKSETKETNRNLLLSMLFLLASFLIKYSTLPFFVAFSAYFVLRKQFKNLVFLSIPLVILTLWSFWNKIEYDGIHLLDRPTTPNEGNNILETLACFGALSPFSFLLLNGIYNSKKASSVLIGVLICLLILPIILYFIPFNEILVGKILNWAFILNGFLILIILIFANKNHRNLSALLSSPSSLFWLIFLGFLSFFAFFAPFIATRHLLLALPFFLFLASPIFQNANALFAKLSLFFCLIYTCLLGLSDWLYADFYREATRKIETPMEGKIWHAGHWGWQYYANKAGWSQYHTHSSQVAQDDWIIFPKNVAIQQLYEGFDFSETSIYTQESSPLTFLSGNNFASLYNNFIHKAPWQFSHLAVDTIVIGKVDKSVNYLARKIKSDSTWYNNIKTEALKSNRDLDKLILENAQWVWNQNHLEETTVLKEKSELEKTIDKIKSDEKWLNSVKEKASKSNISLDSMLILDAQWVIENP